MIFLSQLFHSNYLLRLILVSLECLNDHYAEHRTVNSVVICGLHTLTKTTVRDPNKIFLSFIHADYELPKNGLTDTVLQSLEGNCAVEI